MITHTLDTVPCVDYGPPQGDDEMSRTLEDLTKERIKELEEALKLIRSEKIRRIYLRFSGDILIEVTRDEAIEYLEKEIAKYLSLINSNELE